MTGQIVVGLCGPIGAGKTTVARRLVETHGFVRAGFADALKDEVARVLSRTLRAYLRATRPDIRTRDDLGGIDDVRWEQYLHTALWETRDPFCRALLQEWGTELRRAEDARYWVTQWERRIATRPRVVTDDCRFVNEAEAIRGLGGFLVQVRRPGYLRAGHASETALADWVDYDFTLDNDGDLSDLHADVDRITKAIMATTTHSGQSTTESSQ